MTAVLRGPADPDAFRIKIGRYQERWYHDPLPGCDIADATDDSWPSATTVRNAWPKFLTNWAAEAAARYAVEHFDEWRNLEADVAIEVIKREHERIRDRAGDRGSAIHHALEAIAAGKPLDELVDAEIADWIPAMRQLIVDVDPTWVLSEAVAISRTLGLGGTLDAIWTIDGRNYLVDFKSRAAGKVDTSYEDEGVQLGMYGAADYVIVQDGDRAVRRRLPDLAGGLIVSIAPEGHRLFPVDLDTGREAASVLRRFWQVQADRAIVGKPVLLANQPHTTPTVSPDAGHAVLLERRSWVIGCIAQIRDLGHLDDLAQLWPDGVPTFKGGTHDHTMDELAAIAEACAEVGRRRQLPFFDPDPLDRAVPVHDERASALLEAADALPADLVAKVEADAPLAALRAGKARTGDIDLVAMALTVAGAAHETRREHLQAQRAAFGDDALFPALVRLASGQHAPRPLSRFTDQDVARLESLIAGIDAGVVSVAIDGNGEVAVLATDGAAKVLIDRHGGRNQVRDYVRPRARDLGCTIPRSVADVVADPILTALAAS